MIDQTIINRLARKIKDIPPNVVTSPASATDGNIAVFDDNGKAIKDGGTPSLGLMREYLALTKISAQTVSASAVTDLTWQTAETIGGASLASMGTNRIDINANCYGLPELYITCNNIASGEVLSAIIYLNGLYIAQSYFYGGSAYPRATAFIKTRLPLALNAGDYLEAKVYSTDTDYEVQGNTQATFFTLEAWAR